MVIFARRCRLLQIYEKFPVNFALDCSKRPSVRCTFYTFAPAGCRSSKTYTRQSSRYGEKKDKMIFVVDDLSSSTQNSLYIYKTKYGILTTTCVNTTVVYEYCVPY